MDTIEDQFDGQFHPKLDLASSNEDADIVITQQAVMDVYKGEHLILVADVVDAFILPVFSRHMWLGFPCILCFTSSWTNMRWHP